MVPLLWKVTAPFHGVNNFGNAERRDLDDDFNLVCGEVVAHKLVLESRTVVDFDDTANWVSYGVADVFTGQAVLERGSANSDVFEE